MEALVPLEASMYALVVLALHSVESPTGPEM